MSNFDPSKVQKADLRTPDHDLSKYGEKQLAMHGSYTLSSLWVRKTSQDPAWNFNKQESHHKTWLRNSLNDKSLSIIFTCGEVT